MNQGWVGGGGDRAGGGGEEHLVLIESGGPGEGSKRIDCLKRRKFVILKN